MWILRIVRTVILNSHVCRCDSIEKLRAIIPQLRNDLADKRKCKEIYGYTFSFALDQGQKTLPPGVCVEFWKLLLPYRFYLSVIMIHVRRIGTGIAWVFEVDLIISIYHLIGLILKNELCLSNIHTDDSVCTQEFRCLRWIREKLLTINVFVFHQTKCVYY